MEWLRWILLAVGAILIGAIYVAGRRHQQRPRGDDAFPEHSFGVDAAGHDPAPAARQEPTFDLEPNLADPDRDGPGRDGDTADPWTAPDLPVESVAVEDPVEFDDARPEPTADERHRLQIGASAAQRRDPEREFEAELESASVASEETGAAAPEPAAETAEPAHPPEAPAEKLVVLYVVAAEGRRLVGAQLAEAFARHELEHGELGAFHARARDGSTDANGRPATEFSVANLREPGSFDPATMDTLSTPGVVLILRVPGPPAPLAAFERMVVTARDLARELDGRVLDEKHTPLTRQSEQLLRDDLRRLAATAERSA